MLSPNPLSLFCALLLCLPLAIVFTTTTTTTITITTISSYITLDQNTTTSTTVDPIPQPNPNLRTSFSSNGKQQSKLRQLKTVEEDKDDEETLFGMASHAKQKATYPRKIAFLFLTTTPLPFAPLWESYFNKTSNKLFNIYIHADPTSSYNPPFSGIFSNRLIPSKPTARFSPTLTSAARRLLAQALIHDASNYIFVLLSASCIPLHSFNFTYRTLVNSSLIHALRSDRPRYGDGNGENNRRQRRHDPFLFARKFAPDALQPLMEIANDVIFRDYKLTTMLSSSVNLRR